MINGELTNALIDIRGASASDIDVRAHAGVDDSFDDFRLPAGHALDGGEWESGNNYFRVVRVESLDCGGDPFEQFVGGPAIDDVIADVGDEGDGARRRRVFDTIIERVPESGLEDAGERARDDTAGVAERSTVSCGGDDVDGRVEMQPGGFGDDGQAVREVGSAEKDDASALGWM